MSFSNTYHIRAKERFTGVITHHNSRLDDKERAIAEFKFLFGTTNWTIERCYLPTAQEIKAGVSLYTPQKLYVNKDKPLHCHYCEHVTLHTFCGFPSQINEGLEDNPVLALYTCNICQSPQDFWLI